MDIKQFWQAIGLRATGSTVVTASIQGEPAGFLGLSATHICADPPTMLVAVSKQTSALDTILQARHLAINYLPESAAALADAFAGKTSAKGTDRFDQKSWTTLATGAPILRGAVGAIDCEFVENLERYGTVIILGKVVATSQDPAAFPLIHFRGSYEQLAKR
jgi:flavin reductase (DIM6/NTAB) family NADH-FMN oxidoreductase RutF